MADCSSSIAVVPSLITTTPPLPEPYSSSSSSMQILKDLTPAQLLLAGAAFVVLYTVVGVVHRLYLSPIAKFPGPKLAAATLWYEFYFDVILRGKYTWEIRRMHEKYGPIVRINPYELHIDDPDYYDELYTGPSKRRDKWEWSAKMFGNSNSGFGTVSHDHHRVRRAPLSPFFSKQSVVRLEPVIQSLVDALCARFRDFRDSGEPLNLGVAYSALTTDVMTEYSFAKPYDCLTKPNFAPELSETLTEATQTCHLMKQFGWLFPLMKAMPDRVVALTNPNMLQMINYLRGLERQVQEIMSGGNESYKTAAHPTLFHELLNSDLSAAEKTLERLVEEGATFVGAGIITTAHVLKTTSFHLLANPEILKKLKTELLTVMPDATAAPPLRRLEQLPYLSAVISEGLRVSYGISSRLARVSPDEPLIFRGHKIPPGTPVSMTSVLMHENPTYFPEPHEFRPERWLEKQKPGVRLETYLVPFSRGTRICLGMNLAYAELYLALAAVFRQFDLELFETTRDDVDIVHDFFNPLPRLDSKGVRVFVK